MSDFINHHELEDMLNEVLELMRDTLHIFNLDPQIDGMHSLIWAGEEEVAWEQLWSHLHELKLPISQRVYDLLERSGQIMNVSSDLLQQIKSQING